MNEERYMPWMGKEEPPCDCQKCQRRHGQCAEFTALNRPNYPYNRGYCGWYLKEEESQHSGDSTPRKGG